MDNATAARVIQRFWRKKMREWERLDAAIAEEMREEELRAEEAFWQLEEITRKCPCGNSCVGSDWAWTGHCSRSCAVYTLREDERW